MNAPNVDALAGAGKSQTNGNAQQAQGNSKLNEAFEFAIKGATQTLTITTKKGADLYALKQRPQ